jgi:hypothetical protein
VSAAVAAARSDPESPAPARTRFAPDPRASRSTADFVMSARTWYIVARFRVDVWKSRQRSHGATNRSNTS